MRFLFFPSMLFIILFSSFGFSSNKCDSVFSIYNVSQTQDVESARQAMLNVIRSQKGLTFEDAIEFVLKIMPEGDVKQKFISNLKTYVQNAYSKPSGVF